MPNTRVALEPSGVRAWLGDAIQAGGGELVGAADADVLVWAEPAKAGELDALLCGEAANVQWVQLPWAGIEPYVEVIQADVARTERTGQSGRARIWTCAKGVYAEPVAEHALTLLLAGLRGIGQYARATSWTGPRGTNLLGAKLVVLGGGGITESFLRLVAPFNADVTVVRRNPDRSEPLVGANRVVDVSELDDALDGAMGVVLALALTPETEGIIGRKQLERMHPRGWIVNVARGRHLVTDDLVAVLQAGDVIGGAALDVTDPEPLPEDHPLWSLPNCIVTPHVGNTPEMALPLLSARITENVRRWQSGEPLLGLVDADLGY